jgi:mannose-1-phosphate guanylyltransferase/phosphomannomutase
MQAVVMAGGEGSRLRPLTINRPKPMVPVVHRQVLGHILELLRRYNFSQAIATLQYRAEDIQTYFGDGAQVGIPLSYSVEPHPLGTAGSVKYAEKFLARDEPFLIISGDALTDFDLNAIVAFHKRVGAAVTLTLYRVPNPLEYGVIIVNNEGRIERFLEKPSWGEVISDTVNTGIYVVSPEVLDEIEPDVPVDFSKDLFPRLMKKGAPLYGYIAEGYWCDIGNIPRIYARDRRCADGQSEGRRDRAASGRRHLRGRGCGDCAGRAIVRTDLFGARCQDQRGRGHSRSHRDSPVHHRGQSRAH